MKIRMIDYLASPGGGVRFAVELLRGMRELHSDLTIELVSFGKALERHRFVFHQSNLDVSLQAIRPLAYWTHRPATRVWGIPKTTWLKRLLGFGRNWRYAVPEAAVSDCDVAWFPWVTRHCLPRVLRRPVIGTLHDAIIFQWPGLLPDTIVRGERRMLFRWLRSRARIVVGSLTTRRVVARLSGVPESRFRVIPPGWNHVRIPPEAVPNPAWPWTHARYVLCPANTTPHKNHEVLFQAIALWGSEILVVLTGHDTDLPLEHPRGRQLRDLAAAWGLQLGKSIIPLGYVPDDEYFRLLRRAWAVIMPSHIEGGGSFPVMEAMICGVPVISSDIPVMREQLARVGGEVLWFNPNSPTDLAERLRELEERYEQYRALAEAQAAHLRFPSWKEAAQAYWELMTTSFDG